MSDHKTYVMETAIRKVLADAWRTSCASCRWEGPMRYDKARAERDGHEHTADKARRAASSEREAPE